MICLSVCALCSHCWEQWEAVLGQVLAELPELPPTATLDLPSSLGSDIKRILLFINYLSRGLPQFFTN